MEHVIYQYMCEALGISSFRGKTSSSDIYTELVKYSWYKNEIFIVYICMQRPGSWESAEFSICAVDLMHIPGKVFDFECIAYLLVGSPRRCESQVGCVTMAQVFSRIWHRNKAPDSDEIANMYDVGRHHASQHCFRRCVMHWKPKIVNLTTFSSLVALQVVMMTTYSATSDDKVVKLMIFCFQWMIVRSTLWLHWCSVQCNTVVYAATTGLILGLHPANERRRYKVTPSLIG